MLVRLHSQATPTPKIRAAIQASDEPAWVLEKRHATAEQTVWKWRNRNSVQDRSHTPHHRQTTLTQRKRPWRMHCATRGGYLFVQSTGPPGGSSLPCIATRQP